MRLLLFALSLLLFTDGASAQTKPFGMEEILTLGPVHAKWDAVRQASKGDANSPELIKFASQFRALSGLSLLGHVNLAVNNTLRIVSDFAQWGVEDHWSPALESLASRKGDCEDYAILKYAILKLFLPESSLRIIVGRNLSTNMHHAFLLVLFEGQWLALNNNSYFLVQDNQIRAFQPVFSLSESGTYLLVLTPTQSISQILSKAGI